MKSTIYPIQNVFPLCLSKGFPAKLLLTAALFFFCSTTVTSAESLILGDSVNTYHLGGSKLDILEDKTGKLTIADVTSSQFSGSFKKSDQQVPSFGMTDSAFWFRFTVDFSQRADNDWLLLLDQPLMDEVDLYIPHSDGSFDVKSSGDARSITLHALPGRNILLPLTSAQSSQTFYLRTWLPGRAIFPFTVLTKNAYHKMESAQSYIMVAYSGFMLSIFLLGLFLFLLLKDRNYLFYMLYVLTVVLSILLLKGYLGTWLFEGHLWIHNYIIAVILSLVILAGTLFGRSFLKTDIYAPRLDLILKWVVYLSPIFIVLIPFIPHLACKKLLNITLLISSLIIVAAAVAGYRQGFSSAIYFLYARFFLYTGVITFSLVNIGVLPNNFFTNNSFMIATVIDIIFISLALGDNFRKMNRRITTLVNDLQFEVSERAAANRALEEQMAERKRLEREIVRISDEERRKISHELHDGLCQQLTGARLICAAIPNSNGMEPVLPQLRNLLDDAINNAYNLSRGLWPIEHNSDREALSLEELTRRISSQSGIDIAFSRKAFCDDCTNGQMTQMYRIAQEAITNAVKHSSAREIRVSLECSQEGAVVLRVKDDGIGFGSSPQLTPGGMGMKIMAHRADMIGGTLEVRSGEHGGVEVVCKFPCGINQMTPLHYGRRREDTK